MRKLLALAAASSLMLCTSNATATGLFAAVQQLVIYEEFTQRCAPGAEADVAKLMAGLASALVSNAKLVHPDVSEAKLRGDVDLFMRNMREQAKAMPDGIRTPCDSPGSVKYTKELPSRLNSIVAKLQEAGEMHGQYDTKVALSGIPGGPQTYAVTEIHEDLLFGIVGNSDGKCPLPRIEQIELAIRTPAEFSNLPPFVLPPISYRERWLADCSGKKVWYSVSFNQDSEGFSGVWEIHRE